MSLYWSVKRDMISIRRSIMFRILIQWSDLKSDRAAPNHDDRELTTYRDCRPSPISIVAVIGETPEI